MVRGALFYGLALAAAVHAVFVPDTLPDGLYTIPFDAATGEAIGDPILERSLDFSSRVLPRQRLPRSETRCTNNGAIDINSYQIAKEALQSQCDRREEYAASTAIVLTSGRSIAYLCVYNGPNTCLRSEYEEAMQRVVQQCGSGQGGEVFIPTYGKAYGGSNSGREICIN